VLFIVLFLGCAGRSGRQVHGSIASQNQIEKNIKYNKKYRNIQKTLTNRGINRYFYGF